MSVTRTQAVNLSYCVDQCHAIFGDAVDPKAGSAAVIKTFGGANPQGTNIFFSQGGDDPWQQAGVKVSQGPSTCCACATRCGVHVHVRVARPWTQSSSLLRSRDRVHGQVC